MHTGVWIIVLTIILIVIVYSTNRHEHFGQSSSNDLQDKVEQLERRNNYLEKVKIVDEAIFDYIRCINVPRSTSCTAISNEKLDNGQNLSPKTGSICRSRQIDCNKYKLMLENDSIAVERMKRATDLYGESNPAKNQTEFTYPIRSWWYF
jgi:hypothetical protein